jgi:hypothetical protein
MKAIACLAAAFALFCIYAPPCNAGPIEENVCLAQQDSRDVERLPQDVKPPGTMREGEKPVLPETQPPAEQTPRELQPRDVSPPGTVEGQQPVLPETQPPAERTPRELQPRDASPPGTVLEGEKPVMPESQLPARKQKMMQQQPESKIE